MRRRVIVDAGPLVALFDKDAGEHRRVLDYFRNLNGQLLSTVVVIAEVIYVLDFSHKAQQDFLKWAFRGAIKLVDLTDDDGEHIIGLHAKYADCPMDFADATLVAIADRLGVCEVATLDGDFRIYRYRQRQTFDLPLLELS